MLMTVPTATCPPQLDPAMPDGGSKYWRCITQEQDSPPPWSGNLGGRPFLLAFSLKALRGRGGGAELVVTGWAAQWVARDGKRRH